MEENKMSNEEMDKILKEVYSFIITAETISCNSYIPPSFLFPYTTETIDQRYKKAQKTIYRNNRS